MRRWQTLPGGRFRAQNASMRSLLSSAFNSNNSGEIRGLPGWVDDNRYDIDAKVAAENLAAGPVGRRRASAPAAGSVGGPVSIEIPQGRAARRGVLAGVRETEAQEGRPRQPHVLQDHERSARRAAGLAGTELPERHHGAVSGELDGKDQGLNWPVQDATGLDGAWDFSLTYSAGIRFSAARGGDGDATGRRGVGGNRPGGRPDAFSKRSKGTWTEAGAAKAPDARDRDRPHRREADGKLKRGGRGLTVGWLRLKLRLSCADFCARVHKFWGRLC